MKRLSKAAAAVLALLLAFPASVFGTETETTVLNDTVLAISDDVLETTEFETSEVTEFEMTQTPGFEIPEPMSVDTYSENSDIMVISAPDLTRDFVTRLYEVILFRSPDQKGLDEWVATLKSGINTGADIVSGFVFSKEFLERNYSNREYVEVLYQAILGRASDAQGLSEWISVLEDGLSRNHVLAGFIGSKEFSELCRRYQITPGKITVSGILDENPKITRFVNYLYRYILSRNSDNAGLKDWVTQLARHEKTAAEVVYGFVFSPEFLNKNLSNEDYVSVLYKTILDRAPDYSGLRYWCEYLESGMSRVFILKGFVESTEFAALSESYGIIAGTITVNEPYQNPPEYYQVKNSIAPLTGGGYNLTMGYEGLKVAWTIKRLGVNNGQYVGMTTVAYYGNQTTAAVRTFQQKNNLPVTGNVDLATWLAMGYSENEWYHLGAYVSPLLTNAQSTRQDHIEAMINTAYTYLGTDYVVGASGAPGTGVDCSGLAMQALYGAGIDMETITPITHSLPGHEYESANMWASSKFMHVPYSQRERGDLIFYQDSTGAVIHVAIYLGNDQVIESTVPANKVIIAPIINGYRGNIKGVARPFV